MGRLVVAVAVVAAFVAALTGPAPAGRLCHPIGPHLVARGNLDADRGEETLVELEGPVDCAHSAFLAQMQVVDTCSGTVRVYEVSAAYRRRDQQIDRGEIVEADGRRGRREAFFVLHGGTADSGEAAIVHLVASRRGACPRPRFLFRYKPAQGVHDFAVDLADFSKRFPGLEVRLTEHVGLDGTDIAVRTFRFDRVRGRYVPYVGADLEVVSY